MKTRSIINICKKSHRLCVHKNDETQWIGDGASLYTLYNLPVFDEDSLCNTYDITDKQRNSIHFSFVNSPPNAYDLKDNLGEHERLLSPEPVGIVIGGTNVTILRDKEAMYCINSRYYEPLSDIPCNTIETYIRQASDGKKYFAIKSGYILYGLVVQCECFNADVISSINRINRGLADMHLTPLQSSDCSTL